jgi:hypothetical protein
VFNIIQNPSYELQEMGLACMRGMVEKFGEKLVSRALDIFERLLDMATESNQTVGICKVLFNMTQASTFRLLTVISPRMISILEDNLSSEIPEIREWSAKVFITMFSRQSDKNFIEPTLNKVIFFKLKKYVRENKQDEADRLIVSLKMMISSTGDLRLEDRLLKTLRDHKEGRTLLRRSITGPKSNCSIHCSQGIPQGFLPDCACCSQ